MKIMMQATAALAFSLTPMVAACAQASPPAETTEATAQDTRLETANAMINAWNTQNWQTVVDLFADDGVLHSVMLDPIVGRESISTRIFHMGEGIDEITLNIHNIGVVGDVVIMERTDEFVYNGHAGSVPVVGVLEIRDGKVQVWREYYDRAELLEAMGLQTDFDAEAR